jgi:endonuclease/exonuclease/phosphatase family metal-dependent hydrolase
LFSPFEQDQERGLLENGTLTNDYKEIRFLNLLSSLVDIIVNKSLMENLKIVTFNIRCDYSQDGKNNFVYRKPLIKDKIDQEIPDIIGWQEVLPHVASWLKDTFPLYEAVGVGRAADLSDEQTAILFRKDRFELMDMRTFWLSSTPEIPGSRYQRQSSCPRTCTYVILHDLLSKKVIKVYNTHLDYQEAEPRILGVRLIMESIENDSRFPEAPVILMGDFNATPDSEEIRLLRDLTRWVDVSKDIGGTFQDFGRDPNPQQIDYLFADRSLSLLHASLWSESKDGVYLTDHSPIMAVFGL